MELQQALAYMVANIRKREREEKAKHVREIYDQEVIIEQPTSSITPTPCSLPGPRREETITVTHADINKFPSANNRGHGFCTTGH